MTRNRTGQCLACTTTFLLMFLGLMLSASHSQTQAQDAKDWDHPASKVDHEAPRLELKLDTSDLAAYETELRYRMYLKMISFVLLLGVLHLIQVKLKINRGYFWFMVGGVVLLFVLNSYRPKYDPNKPRPASDESPTYAPTHAR